ncbi:MAG: heavy-metal-associated domain-containing protein [Sandaracinaceae bacterium]|nr:heavy-metal-associated domain-containing protein [Sandaracinaceae bacterium]
MTCAACVRRVEKALRGVAGVREASVSLPLERATVTFDPAVARTEALVRAIEKAGYGVASAPVSEVRPGTDAQRRAEQREAADDVERRALVRDFAPRRRAHRAAPPCSACRTAPSPGPTGRSAAPSSWCSRASSSSGRAGASSASRGSRPSTGRAT